MKKLALFFVLVVKGFTLVAQNQQLEYLEAKRLLQTEKFTAASAAFGSLIQSEVFGAYASFYYAYASFKNGDKQKAMDMWKQLLLQYPQWEQKSEVLYWMAYVSFKSGEWEKGLEFSSKLSDETFNSIAEEKLIQLFISPLSIPEVQALTDAYPKNKYLAGILVNKLNAEPYAKRDFDQINQLIGKWKFDIADYSRFEIPNVKKDTYNIAILLPFLFESLENPRLIVQNDLVMDMYQGMLLAAEDLKSNGNTVRLNPYDTKRKGSVTNEILSKPTFKDADLIIGPLYSEPNEMVNKYALANQLNTFNPISSNAEVIGDNPFSFLIRPSNETLALKMAELAIDENTNPYVMIFYENTDRDSIFAAVYRKAVEDAGFEIVVNQAITKENAKPLLDTLVAQYDRYLTEEQADSISKIPGRFVRDRRIRSDEIKRMEKDTSFFLPVSKDENNKKITYYERLFYMEPDSIGHILTATRSNLFANNLISAVETRGDSTRLYGSSDWLDFTMLSFNQLERLQVALYHTEYYNHESYSYQELEQKFIRQFKTKPSINHLRGYEIVWYTGQMLHTYGKYFQHGIRSGSLHPGKVFEGYRYGANNDNQVVPIVRFKESTLEVVNRDLYERREE